MENDYFICMMWRKSCQKDRGCIFAKSGCNGSKKDTFFLSNGKRKDGLCWSGYYELVGKNSLRYYIKLKQIERILNNEKKIL